MDSRAPALNRFANAELQAPRIDDAWGLRASSGAGRGVQKGANCQTSANFCQTVCAVTPRELPRTDGSVVRGFWFALPIRPARLPLGVIWQRRGESDIEADVRRGNDRSAQSTGLVAAFIDGPGFLAEFNADPVAPVHVKLYSDTTPSPDCLLNPAPPPPPSPRHQTNLAQPWYGRSWTVRLTSTAAFETLSLRYRARLVAVVGSLLSLAGAGILAWQIRHRLQADQLAARLRDTLERQECLARDLHDGTLQSAYAIGLGLQRASRLLRSHPDQAPAQLAETESGLRSLIQDLRRFLSHADPGAADPVHLDTALTAVLSHFRSSTEATILADLEPGSGRDLSPPKTLHLLNIAREAISNSIRHSRARTIRVALRHDHGRRVLEISDDGCGFEPASSPTPGRGLSNIAARAAELGARTTWIQPAGGGTLLRVEVNSPTDPARAPAPAPAPAPDRPPTP